MISHIFAKLEIWDQMLKPRYEGIEGMAKEKKQGWPCKRWCEVCQIEINQRGER